MNQRESWIDHLFARNRWMLHVLFWMIVLVLYAVFFGRRNSNYIQTFFFVGLLMPVTIVTTYFLNYILIPRYLLRERYYYFALYFLYALIGSIFLEAIIAMLTFLIMAEAKIKAMSPASIDIFFLLAALLMVVFFAVSIKLLLHWRQSKEDYQKLMREKLETELRFLKTQLNPHFLFNTLNNLYYLAMEKSDRTPQAILALSEILDYVLHSGVHTQMSVSKEWQQVENYINLEMMRYQDRLTIVKSVTGDLTKHSIGPVMLLTLVENAFKHGAMNVSGKSKIEILLMAVEDQFRIRIENEKRNLTSPLSHGVGLKNLKQQLIHLYPTNHDFSIEDTETKFMVQLTIKRS